MRFMMFVKANAAYEAGQPPDPRLMEAVAKLGEEHRRAGTLITTGGLMPSSQSARIVAQGGKLTTLDGPFPETKELVGGYAIFELKSLEEAIVYGRRFMKLHQDVMGPDYEGELEIRPMFSPDNDPHLPR